MFRRRSTGSVIRNALYSKSHGLSSHELGDLSAMSYDTHGLRELEAQLQSKLSKLPSKSDTNVKSENHKSSIHKSENHKSSIHKSENHKSSIHKSENHKSSIHKSSNSRNSLNLDSGNLISGNLNFANRNSDNLNSDNRNAVSLNRSKSSPSFPEASRPKLLRKAKTVDFLHGTKIPSFIDTFSSHFRTDINITVLKCLTIIIHLCQTGSPEFFSWLVSSYRALISPIQNLVFNEPLSRAIQQKASLVIEYCEDSKVLAQARTFSKSLKSQLQPGIVN